METPITELLRLDTVIEPIIANIRMVSEKLTFKIAWEGTLNHGIKINGIWSGPGIYLFEISTIGYNSLQEWVDSFRSKWEDERYKKKFVPNFKEKRIAGHSTLLEYMPLYLGQSENLSKRVREHFELELERPTNALKLLSRENILGTNIKVSVIEMPIKSTRFILPEIETYFRDKINPLVGRQ